MISGIRERTVVNGGQIVLPRLDLPDGTEVEVIVCVEDEMDATEYLLSTGANREHLERALEDAKDPSKRVYIDIEEYEKNLFSS